MSNANVIVTDKTGTLTTNKMRVVEGTIGGTAFSLRDREGKQQAVEEEFAEDGEVKKAEELIELLKKNEHLLDVLAQSVAINSSAFEENMEEERKGKPNGKSKPDTKFKGKNSKRREERQHDDQPKFIGNKTDSALLQMMEVDLKEIRKQTYAKIRDEAETVFMAPFNSDRKAMATAIKLSDGNGYRLFVKGAAEAIIDQCTRRAKLEGDADDETESIDDKYRDKIQSQVDNYAKRSLRSIAMAYKDFEEWPPKGASGGEDGKTQYDDIAKELTLLALPGIEDPLREGVVDAVKKCQMAGVSVKMCTGDNLLTAR